jgi:pimeloyl-ACP methyl ester carboxylesterase
MRDAESAAADSGRFVRGADGLFHVLDWGGSGPAAHLAHATGLSAGTYGPLARLLTARLHVFGMDDRGHGRTRAPCDPARLANWDVFVDDLAAVIAEQGEPVVAMGHSRGAAVSLLLAVKRPELVRALVLIDPTILPRWWMPWWYVAKRTGLAGRLPIVRTAARRRRLWPGSEALLAAFRGKPVFGSWGDAFLEAYVESGAEDTGDGRVRLSCDPAWESRCFAVCPHDIWRSVARLTLPVLVVFGRRSDTFLPAAAKRFKQMVPHARMCAFEDAGHFVPMERPQETVAAAFGFLEDNGILERAPA